ncbi:P60-like protein [Microstroma glucosiphilum]|uniref:Ribosome biogenesis protein NOP53 n=1 Tax=Pseudomicrostroma glucosiphilum TaxID=1684307 RepID=A0A316TZF1_9BASI|nr:P60-like protein [Pseudomicrostroma glucosiphilum]PWN18044.1 P60-like protein [Pseudomicrostroma glucosiphilum]
MAPSTSRASSSRSSGTAAATSAAAAAGPAAKKKTASSSQPSRKNKASWRRNIDLSEVDEHLESARVAERLGLERPGALKTSTGEDGALGVADAGLFEVDTKGDEALGTTLRKRKEKKPMRFLASLQNESAVPAVARKGVTPAGAATFKGSKTGKMSKIEQDRLRRIARRPVKGPFGAIVESEQGNALEGIKGAILRTPEEDVWNGGEGPSKTAVEKAKADEDWIEEARKKEIKTPAHLTAAGPATVVAASSVTVGKKGKGKGKAKASAVGPVPTLASFLSLPSTGQSYNPTFTSHATLLQKAYQAELAKMKSEEEEKAFKLRWTEAAKAQRDMEELRGDEEAGRVFRGMIVGEIPSTDEHEEERVEELLENDADADAADEEKAARVSGLRKTKAQRQKEARAKQLLEQAEAKKRSKALSQSLASLPTLQKTIKKEQAARAALLESRRLAKLNERASKGLAGQRSGKFKVPSSASTRAGEEVQLGEELSEGLRGVKTEGNLFRDQWDGLMIKGRVEPRLPVAKQGRSGRKYGGERKKEYETHAYKRFE